MTSTRVFRDDGQASGGPSRVAAQSCARIRAPISPLATKTLGLPCIAPARPARVVRALAPLLLLAQQAPAGPDDLAGVPIVTGYGSGAPERIQLGGRCDVAGLVGWHTG